MVSYCASHAPFNPTPDRAPALVPCALTLVRIASPPPCSADDELEIEDFAWDDAKKASTTTHGAGYPTPRTPR